MSEDKHNKATSKKIIEDIEDSAIRRREKKNILGDYKFKKINEVFWTEMEY